MMLHCSVPLFYLLKTCPQDLEIWLETASTDHPLKGGTQQLMRQLSKEQGGPPAETPQLREHSRQ